MLETNKIYNGDSYKLIKEIEDDSIDLVCIDPPYEISVSHDAGAFGVEKKLHYAQFEELSFGITNEILDEICRVLKKINIYVFCSKNQIQQLLDYFVTKRNCNWTLIEWHKTNPVPACGNSYMSDTEFCLFFREKGVKVYGTAESKKTYYITPINTLDKAKWKHPTIKPLHMIKNLIFNSTKENEIVLDCFSGSGTTALACHDLKINFLCVEKDEEYHKTSCERLQNAQAQLTLF